jgi:glucokinase
LIKQTKEAMKQDKVSIRWKFCDYNLEKVEGKTLFDAVRLLDETAKKSVAWVLRRKRTVKFPCH